MSGAYISVFGAISIIGIDCGVDTVFCYERASVDSEMETVKKIHCGISLEIEGVTYVFVYIQEVCLYVVTVCVYRAVKSCQDCVAVVIHFPVGIIHYVALSIADIQRIDRTHSCETVKHIPCRVGYSMVVGSRTSHFKERESLGVSL